MKRILITFALAAVSLLCARAQSVDNLIEKYAYQKSAVTVTMPAQILKKMARRDDNDLLRKLTEIKIISISGSDGNCLRNRFLEDARRLTARRPGMRCSSRSAMPAGGCRPISTDTAGRR